VRHRVVSTLHGMAVGVGALHIIYAQKLFDRDVFRPYTKDCDNLFATTLVRPAAASGVHVGVHGRR